MIREARHASDDAPGSDLPTESLKNEIVREMGLVYRDPDAATAHAMRAAELFVTLRERYFLPDGTPDVSGKGWQYKRDVRDLYASASVPPDQVGSLKARIRHHIGNVLRNRYPEETLEDAGLAVKGPTERERERRHERAERLRKYMAEAAEADHLAALEEMSPEERRQRIEDLRAVSAALGEEIAALLRAAE